MPFLQAQSTDNQPLSQGFSLDSPFQITKRKALKTRLEHNTTSSGAGIGREMDENVDLHYFSVCEA